MGITFPHGKPKFDYRPRKVFSFCLFSLVKFILA
ncbi:hypothetical protein PQD69_gp100 [Carnobacterium phage cd4]|uniref:Uncharacterized protein n=1 Tax=Carnobacterium phage cd4 TaxID=2849246 RepID=A0AAE7SVE1_9CAUD|nr:hypothetical protein PQD69_gp100 [Carnobacterium phage cd4]QXP45410.1 hypothetical protein cd4_100 [Carnobacterium phage cd4]